MIRTAALIVLASENSYLVRYVGGDGRLVETWWGDSALTPSGAASAQAA